MSINFMSSSLQLKRLILLLLGHVHVIMTHRVLLNHTLHEFNHELSKLSYYDVGFFTPTRQQRII